MDDEIKLLTESSSALLPSESCINEKKIPLEFYTYSAGQIKRYKYCFMKQKFQLPMDIARYINVITPLSTRGINTTYQHFQMRLVTLFQFKGLKSYQLM